MKTFQDFIQEGVNDPGIFKAFYTAGGPGSGKSYVAAASGGGGLGKGSVGVSRQEVCLSQQASDL